jgi:subtilisin family serine protease
VRKRATVVGVVAIGLFASIAGADGVANFVQQPGVLEFSGRLFVRPLQVGDLVTQGMNVDAATAQHDQALQLLAPDDVEILTSTDDHVIDIPDGFDENTYSDFLMNTGLFQYAHPDWICYPVDTVPNDPQVGAQWQHGKIQSYKAWDIHTGTDNVTVGIVDTGVDSNHPDLAAALVPGFNAVSNLSQQQGGEIEDFNGHGTFTSGCAAAIGNNNVQVCGIGWDFHIMPIKVVVGGNGGASFGNLTQGAQWAAANGARAVNVSYSGVNSTGVNTTGQFVKNQGGLLCWAAGNDNVQLTLDHASAIVVGATTIADVKAGFSNWGKPIDIVAPGQDVRSTTLGGSTGISSGTSFSSPIVAGAVALIFSTEPSLTPDEAEAVLYEGAVDLGAVGEDNFYGAGRLNTYNTLSLLGDVVDPPVQIALPFFEDVEDFVMDATEWQIVDGAEVSGGANNPPSGFATIHLDETDSITTQQLETLDLLNPPQTPFYLSFYSEHRQVEAGKSLNVEFFSELQQDWLLLDEIVSDGVTQNEFDFFEYEMPVNAYGDTLQIRFTFDGDAADDWYLDDIGVSTTPAGACFADFNADGSLSILDFVAFQTAFSAGDDAADCNDDGSLSVLDFVCFQQAFLAGCP